jgi:enamine deaminase RidA (YjgF/YER057c/UK114 family)
MSGNPAPVDVEGRLAAAGLALPASSPALASYQPAIRAGSLVMTAGQLPLLDGALIATGLVGQEVDVDTARACAQQATLNALSAVRSIVGLSEVAGAVRLVGYVACSSDFTEQPQVLNAASDLLMAAFGESGRHVRSAVGVVSLPLGSPVEIELVVSL